MIRNIDMHKYYIDRANLKVRRMWMVLLTVIAIAGGIIFGLSMKIQQMQKVIEFLKAN